MEINCLTYNVKGLNSPTKRHKALRELHHYSADVVFLQETHLTQDTVIKLYSRNFPNWFYCDSPIKRAKGVAIGFSKRTKFSLIERRTDPEGWYLLLKLRLGERIFTSANVYCPNENPIKFLSQILNRLIQGGRGDISRWFQFLLKSNLG